MGDKVLTDIEIAQAATLDHIKNIAAKLNIEEDDLELYGKYKAKLPLKLINPDSISKSNLILVTALTPLHQLEKVKQPLQLD